jgi:hypothetical protein
MNPGIPNNASSGRRMGRSILALLAGFAVAIVLSVATDVALNQAGVLPPLGEPASDGVLLLATAYRTLYGVIGGYVVAGLAPDRPLQHALIAGLCGLVVCTLGAAATWNRGLGPHWYSLALIALSVPPAWVGGKLRILQQARRTE